MKHFLTYYLYFIENQYVFFELFYHCACQVFSPDSPDFVR